MKKEMVFLLEWIFSQLLFPLEKRCNMVIVCSSVLNLCNNTSCIYTHSSYLGVGESHDDERDDKLHHGGDSTENLSIRFVLPTACAAKQRKEKLVL